MSIRCIFVLAISLTLNGCGNKSEYSDMLECGMAAANLEQDVALQKINVAIGNFVKETGFEISERERMEIGDELYEGLGLKSPNYRVALEKLQDAYNSSYCKNIHGQPEIDLPDM